MALTLGLRSDLSSAEIIEEYIEISRRKPIKPVIVSDGPCQEEVHLGDEADLFEFPVPLFHEHDGGRYIGTWHTVISKDPDTGWVNWGTYRVMVHDSHTLGFLFRLPAQHMLGHYRKYEARNEPMPFAIAIGTEPVTPIISGLRFPSQVDEAGIIGAFREEPLALVKCKTVDLMVPATSEIVIEGEMPPHERMKEGPFGEYTGYAVGAVEPQPIGQVRAITHRRDPILSAVCLGVPVVNCVNMLVAVAGSARILENLRSRRLPVRMVYCPPEAAEQLVAVSVKVPFANFAQHLATIMWGGAGRSPYLVVVDDDVDVTDLGQIVWALCTRCNPAKGIFIMPNLPGYSMRPYLSRQERELGIGDSSALFDCTWPTTWPKEDVPVVPSFETMCSAELRDKVLKNWAKYGYRD